MLITNQILYVKFRYVRCLSTLAMVFWCNSLDAQDMPPTLEESANESIKYIGEKQTDPRYYHGGLQHAVGIHRYQAFRANRAHPPEIDSRSGWTYNHQPYLCYWNDRFYLQYLSNQYTEHLEPGRTLLMTSPNGRNWSNPEILFPEYALPEIKYLNPESGELDIIPAGTRSIMHQRMGFYISKDNRLLTLAFYSFCPNPRVGPNKGQGLGRAVREIYSDGSYGPIYFIRYNRHAGWDKNNTNYPFYKRSSDKGFIKACDELLDDKLMTLQWWEEDRAEDGFFTIEPEEYEPKAFNYFRRPDGVLVGIWKHQLTALSADEGRSWTTLSLNKSLKTCGAKTWGQKTEDGKYALVYNHSATRRNRWPLTVMSSEDGHKFDNLLCLHGEVPPMRYYGWSKNHGPQYIRGIFDGNGDPPGSHLWLTYSVNKEDIWVCRTRVPVAGIVSEHVNQNFQSMNTESDLEWWNLYNPKWASVKIINVPGSDKNVLQLRDEEPYDYACAERAFPPSSTATIEFSLLVRRQGKDILEFELHNEDGERALRLRFDVRLDGLNFDLGLVKW
jgi:hypothetical protein